MSDGIEEVEFDDGADELAKLERAVREQADSLDPAQKEFVLAEFRIYRWNAKKIRALEKKLNAGGIDPDVQSKYFRQRHQLVAEQASLFSHIMRWLKGTAAGKSEFDKFLEG